MFNPEVFDPLIGLFLKTKFVRPIKGLEFAASHTCACAHARAAHMSMTLSPNIQIHKKIEIVIWDNLERVRKGASFAADMGVTRV